jgi:hypothetical protein
VDAVSLCVLHRGLGFSQRFTAVTTDGPFAYVLASADLTLAPLLGAFRVTAKGAGSWLFFLLFVLLTQLRPTVKTVAMTTKQK